MVKFFPQAEARLIEIRDDTLENGTRLKRMNMSANWSRRLGSRRVGVPDGVR
jgi:hypothetical protein